jgi:1-deoxyxylulose-5-phosphate synthase
MLPLCVAEGVGVLPWSPLARGFLAGNRKRGGERAATEREKSDAFAHDLYYTDADHDVVDRVIEIAAARGVSPAQIALAWLLRQPAVTAPIVGASKMEQLDQAIGALEITLTDEEATRLEQPYLPHAVLGM